MNETPKPLNRLAAYAKGVKHQGYHNFPAMQTEQYQ